MRNALAEPLAAHQRSSERPALRLAVVHDFGRNPTPLVSILVSSGLPPNSGVLPLGRIGELAGDPPHVIVLAADLGVAAGLAALRFLHRSAPDSRIVTVAPDAAGVSARRALNAGAEAFVSEQGFQVALEPAVRAVVAGLVCAPRTTRRVLAKPTFSHREKQVLELMVAGMTNQQIADRLYLAESTVKTHVASAFAKLGVRSRKDATAILLDPAEGLLTIALLADAALLRRRLRSQ